MCAVQVGGFPGMTSQLTRTVRAEVNPMDKSTVVSIFPKEVRVTNNTISPGRFYIPAASFKEPKVLVVGPSSWWKHVDENQPILEIPQSSVLIAESIVRDHCNGLVGCNMSNSMPGIFWVPGEFDEKTIVAKHSAKILLAQQKQNIFWKALVQFADTFWARTNGSPLCISEEMRIAAKELGLQDQKDWMKDFSMLARTNCQACGSPVKPGYPVCATCHAIVDAELATKLGIKFSA